MIDDVQNTYRFMVTLDPLDAFVPREILVGILERAPFSFQSCTGLGGELEVTSYPEGGRNDYVHQLPVRHSWGRITLSKGIARDPTLFAWYEAGLYGSLGARRDGAVVMQNPQGIPTMIWTFSGGLAARWSGPGFNAQENGLAIESLEIAHQGIKAIPGPGLFGVA